MSTPKKSTTEKNPRSGLGLTLQSANPNDYPLAYADDFWDIAIPGSVLAEKLGGTGQFDQHTINEMLANSAGQQGEKGDKGDKGDKGEKGDKGDGFVISRVYASTAAMTGDANPVENGRFVAVVLDSVADVYLRNTEQTAGGDNYDGYTYLFHIADAAVIRGEKGDTGAKGDKGDKGDSGATGAAFTYEDFTQEQLDALKGAKGDKGDKGDTGEKGDKGDTGEKGDKGDKGDSGGLTPEQEAWVAEKMQDELQDEANALYSVSQSDNGGAYWADTDTGTTLTLTVTVKFGNENVTPTNHNDIISNGWSSSATGVYTKSVTGASGTITAQTFNYTPANGKYKGINVSKSTTAKAIAAKYPIYYGWASAKNIASLNWTSGNFTRATANPNADVVMANNTGAAAHLFVLTKSGAATVKQSGNPIMDAKIGSQSFTSPVNSQITMSGYNLYFSTGDFAAGASPKFSMNIPLS